jgi:guanylate cyclase
MLLGVRQSVPWFVAYAVLLVALGLVDQRLLRGEPPIPASVVVTFFVMTVAGVSLTIYAILSYFVRERDEAHAALALEQERSERLLLNARGRASRSARRRRALRRGHGVSRTWSAHRAPSAPPLSWSPCIESSPPSMIWPRVGLEKIKTIGDAYMVAGGLPEPRPDHAEAVAEMALAMREHLPAISAPWGRDGTAPLSLRIGIDSGPVVAGVIGRRKFIYDLWGDTVNTPAGWSPTVCPTRSR